MIKEATAMTVRQNLGELLSEIQYRHDQVLITKGGKPVAVMIDVNLFEKIRLLKSEFDRLSAELAGVYKDVDTAIAEVEIAAAITAARKH